MLLHDAQEVAGRGSQVQEHGEARLLRQLKLQAEEAPLRLGVAEMQPGRRGMGLGGAGRVMRACA